jgi:hypothetical protein
MRTAEFKAPEQNASSKFASLLPPMPLRGPQKALPEIAVGLRSAKFLEAAHANRKVFATTVKTLQ